MRVLLSLLLLVALSWPPGLHAAPAAPPRLPTRELPTPRFQIRYTPAAEGAARVLAAEIEEVRNRFGQVLGRDWPGRTEIRLGVGRRELEALIPDGPPPPGWAVALAYPEHQIIVLDALTLAGPEGPITLRHELAHVALGQLGGAWPRWFHEGLAMTLTGERLALSQYNVLFRGLRQERIFHFEDLADRWPERPEDVELAYAQSASFVATLASRHPPEAFGRLVDEMKAGASFETAFARAFRTTVLLEEAAWREGLPVRYGWLPALLSHELVWLFAAALCIAAFLQRRRQKRRRLAAMDAEVAQEEAVWEALGERPPDAPAPPGSHTREPGSTVEPDQDPPPKPLLH